MSHFIYLYLEELLQGDFYAFGAEEKWKNLNTLGIISIGQYHFPSGFINHNIAQKEEFYFVNLN